MSTTSNKFVFIPEFALDAVLTQALIYLREDYRKQVEENNDEELSYLYILTKDIRIQRLKFFEEAKKIFLADHTSPKKINIHMGFPSKLEGALSICITHAGEQHGQNALSTDRMDDSEGTSYGRRYNTTYQLISVGENTNEVIVMNTIIKSLLISFEGTGHLNFMGFQNLKINGQDIKIATPDTSKHLYSKAINLTFEFDVRVPDIERQQEFNAVIFKALLID